MKDNVLSYRELISIFISGVSHFSDNNVYEHTFFQQLQGGTISNNIIFTH